MTKQRILAMLLSVLMVFSLLPVSAMAEEPEEIVVGEELAEEPEIVEEAIDAEEEEIPEIAEDPIEGETQGVEITEEPLGATVAEIGTEQYETLAAAAAAATAADTIKLVDNIEITASVNLSAGTLDLNGKTISATVNKALNVKGTVTITDSAGGGKIAYTGTGWDAAGGIVYVANGGNLTLAGGTICDAVNSGNGAGVYVYGGTSGSASFTMIGGSIDNCTAAKGCALYCATGSTATITGGSIIAAEGSTASVIEAYNGTTTITGGTISGTIKKGINATLTITGGTFSVDPSAYVAEGYAATSTGETGPWTVQVQTEPDPDVAMIGTTGYKNLADALNAVGNGEEITLLENISIADRVGGAALTTETAKAYSINLNGHNISYSGTSNGFIIIRAYHTVTIKGNGTVDVGTNKYFFATNQNSALNIEGGIYKGTNLTAFTYGTTNTSISVTAGTFDCSPEAYVASGYEAVENTDGTWTVQVRTEPEPDVARIGETGYKTLAEAIAAAGADDVVTLLTDVDINASINLAAGTLDLNGKTITAKVAKAINVTGTAKITDGATGGKIVSGMTDIGANSGIVYVTTNGNLTFEGGTINGAKNESKNGGAVYVYSSSGTATFTMTGGTINAGSGVKGLGIYCATGAEVTISGGSINAAEGSTASVIEAYNGTTTITGGTISGAFNKGVNATVTITGGFFSDEPKNIAEGYEAVKLKNPDNAAAPWAVVDSSVTGTITYDVNGGQEGTQPDAKEGIVYLPGYEVEVKISVSTPVKFGGYKFKEWNTVSDGSGTAYTSGATIGFGGNMTLYAIYEVSTDYVAQLGENSYVTLAEAILAADNNASVITLLADVTENVKVEEGQWITILLGEYDITGAGIGSAITNKGTLFIEGTGIISGTAQIRGGGIDNSGTLDVKGVTVTGSAKTGGGINNTGTLTVNSGTISGTATPVDDEGGYGGAIYNSGTAVINGGNISGDAKTGGGLYNARVDEKGYLTVNGGTVSGTATSNKSGAIYSNKDLTIAGGTMNGDVFIGSYTESVAAISGGDLKADVSVGAKATLTVTGGTFDVFNPEQYLASNCDVEGSGTDGDEPPFTVISYAARINGTRYQTLAAAVEAAQEGDTVVLLADVSGQVTLTKVMSIDLNGKTFVDTAEPWISVGEGLLLENNGDVWSAVDPLTKAAKVTIDGTDHYYDSFEEAAAAANGEIIVILSDDVSNEMYELSVGETLMFCGNGPLVYWDNGLVESTEYYDSNLEGWCSVYISHPEIVAEVTIGGEKKTAAEVGGDDVIINVYEDYGEKGRVPFTLVELDWTVLSGNEFVTEAHEILEPSDPNESAIEGPVIPGAYTAVKAGGTVTVKGVVPADPVGRGVSVSFTTIEKALDYKVVDVNDAGETAITEISRAFTGAPIEIIVRPVAAFDVAKTTAVSSDKGVAAVTDLKDGTWKITLSKDKKNVGFCNVTFTPYVMEGTKTVAKTPYVIDVSLLDYLPVMQNKLTINSNFTYYECVTVSPCIGNQILDAELVGNDGKGNPVETVLPLDVFYDYDQNLYVGTTAPFKGTVKTLVKFTTEKGEMYLPLTVTAKNTLPKVTVKQLDKLALYDENAVTRLGIKLSSWDVVEAITVDAPGYDYTIEEGYVYGYDYIAVLSRIPGAAEYASSATVGVKLEYYHDGVNTLSGKTGIGTIAKPSLSLTPATSTLGKNGIKGFWVSVYDKNTKDILPLTTEEIVLPDGYEASWDHEGDVLVIANKELAASNSIPVTIRPDGWNQTVTLKYTLKVEDKAPTVKLSRSTVTLNGYSAGYAETGAYIYYTVNQTNVADDVSVVIEPVTGNANLVVYGNDSQITAFTTGVVPAGTYKYNVRFFLDGVNFKTLPLTVKVANAKLKLAAANKTATLSQSATKGRRTLAYTIYMTNPYEDGVRIGDVTIGSVNGLFRKNLADSGADIRWNISQDRTTLTVYVTVDNTCRMVRNKTYTLPLIITPAGDAAPEVMAKTAAKLNLTLKVVK